jgi:hypothetical protein
VRDKWHLFSRIGESAISFEKEIFFAKKSLFQNLSRSEGFSFPQTLFVAALLLLPPLNSLKAFND